MPASKKETTTTRAKRSRKQQSQPDVEVQSGLSADLQKQGMSPAWQHFYLKVKQAVTE